MELIFTIHIIFYILCYKNDGYGSYICELGHVHDYSKLNLKELEKEAKNNKTYNNAKEMINDILKEV